MQGNGEFGRLFKRFRLKSELETLVEFGVSLQELGFFQEDSTFSRWENGNRIPRDRSLLIAIIKLFVSKGGIKSIDEGNSLMEAAGNGFLTKKEQDLIWGNNQNLKPFQAPRDIIYFSGRKNYIQEIQEKLLEGKVVLLYGLPGSGKTTLATRLSHMLRANFIDGVVWLRLDTITILEALISIAASFGEDISQIHDIYTAASFVRSLVSKKKILFILDNADTNENIDLIIPNSSESAVLITSIYDNYESSYITDKIRLKSFDKNESLSLFKKVLKGSYHIFSEKSLLALAQLFDYLPLPIDIIAHHLIAQAIQPEDLISDIQKRNVELSTYKYGDKNLFLAIELAFNELEPKAKELLLSLALFKGKDFSLEAIAHINNYTKKTTLNYLRKLIESSLVEYSSERRYRLHPVVRYYLYNKATEDKFYKNALDYYTHFLQINKNKQNYFYIIQPEVRTIEGILDYFLKQNKQVNEITNLWKNFNDFLWFRGYWENYKNLNKNFYTYANTHELKSIRLIACTNLGKAYYWLGMLDEAEKYSNEAIILADDAGNEKLSSENTDRLGKILQIRGNYEGSNRLFKTALGHFKDSDEFEKKGNILRHMAEGYMFQGDIENSQKFLKLALDQYLLIDDHSIKHMYQALISSHSATMLYKNNELKAAEKLFVESLRYEKMAGGRAGTKIGSLIGLALIYKDDSYQLDRYLQRAKNEIKTLGIDKNIEKLVVSYHVLKDELNRNAIHI